MKKAVLVVWYMLLTSSWWACGIWLIPFHYRSWNPKGIQNLLVFPVVILFGLTFISFVFLSKGVVKDWRDKL